jgi:D-glycero-alpha-D-manno-heptose-7-phosphate kinase
MIIARSPLRITIGGGGSDLPSYYKQHGGFVISAAIDKYVFVTVTRPFIPGIFLKYSKLEHVEQCAEVQHPIIREALQMLDFRTPQIEITTLADIPAGTGLGSSGSFTTALLKALHAHRREHLHANELARMACEIEIDRLREPVGKQDQYIAAYGGLTCFSFLPNDTVEVAPLRISMDTLHDLEDNLLLFFTGFARKASVVLSDQVTRTQTADQTMINNLHYVRELGLASKKILEAGQTAEFGALMHEQWENKKKRSDGMTNQRINEWYELARKNGALGGKLVGAGGGGFLMFYVEDRNRVRRAMTNVGLQELRFHFDFEGTKTLLA